MESLRQLQQLQQQQQLEQQRQEILSLFGAFEERELQPFDAPSRGPDDLSGSDQLTAVDSQPAQAPAAAPSAGGALVDVAVRAVREVASNVPVKRKRGRPPKVQALLNGKSIPPPPKVDEEEDVCFICFDGGNLVLCDRKGCPKAYHPSCIKRDEEFFQSKAKWNCGWHICSSCEKAAYYMCYTCSYSLCKNCTKDADYVCIRGTKGLCGTCMKTIMLIENIPQANQETVQVDFDDRSSWEYLFKVYWVILKEKLALTIDEVTKAKSPWEDLMLHSVQHTGGLNHNHNDGRYGTAISSKYQSSRNTRGRKAKEQPKLLNLESANEQVNATEQGASSSAHPQWASKELLEFVRYMKNGDMSQLTQFDVQALLLEYIRKNNLRDPRRKCQIVCDSMLMSLFGKTALGHFEMLKLLDSHFLVKEKPRIEAFIRETIVDPSSINVNSDNNLGLDSDKKYKMQKLDERVPPDNPDDYAAVDVHNTCLIYLRLDMMDSLLDDPEKFHDKVVGSFVRVKVPALDPTHDSFRLVQITGTSLVAEPYKIGGKMSNMKLEILNSGKKEVIPIDEISNQEFSEDECKLLRQDIKCGLIKRLTVGDIHQKAWALQEVRVKHWLEAEILRLSNLRDRASEKDHKKELKECVEKIQLLNSPEERQRRLHEAPEIHTDPWYPTMDSDCKAENESTAATDQKKEDVKVKPSNGSNRKRKMSTMEPDVLNRSGNRSQKRRSVAKQNVDVAPTNEGDLSGQIHENDSGQNQRVTRSKKRMNEDGNTTLPLVCGLGEPSVKLEPESAPDTASKVSPSPLSEISDQPINDVDEFKMWHYQDPHGRVQGPFTLAQLRRWSTSGHFPQDLKIWRIEEKQEDSLLLTDALNGRCNKEPVVLPQETCADATDERDDINLNEVKDLNIAEGSLDPKEVDFSSPKTSKEDVVDVTTAAVDTTDDSGGRQIMTVSQVWDSLNDDSISLAQPEPCDSLHATSVPNKPDEASSSSSRVVLDHESCQNSRKLSLFLLADALADEGHSDQTPPAPAVNSNGWDSSSTPTLDKPLETSNQVGEIHFPVLPSAPPPKLRDEEVVKDKQVIHSSVSAPTLVAEVKEVAASEWGGGGYSSVSAKPVDQWGSILVPGTHADALNCSGGGDQLTASTWHANFEGTDFAALGEESVSDLLAEVEAMENGLPSPTSIMKGGNGHGHGHDLNESSKDDCFSPIDVFSPAAPAPGKTNPFSSSSHLLSAPNPPSVADLSDARRNSHSHPHPRRNSTPEAEGAKQSSHLKPESTSSVPHRPSLSPPTTNWHINTSLATPVQGGTHLGGWEGTHSMDWESPRQGMLQRSGSFGSGSTTTFANNQTKHSGSSRYSSPRDRDRERERERERERDRDQGGYGNNSSSRSRSGWSGRPYSSGGGSGSHRLPTKGQKVCKFYESGYCKNGASCSYLHP